MSNRFELTKKAGLFGIIGNLFLLIIKGTAGLLFHSQAMIADATNSASDIFASLMTFVGNKIASEPQDKTHNFGHGKAEYIFSLLISLSMIVISFKLLLDAISSLIYGRHFDFSWLLVVVCILTIITKLALYLYTNAISKKFHNILLDANKKDHRNDCIITTFTLISTLLSLVGIYWFDGIVGIGIAIWICITGAKIFLESYNVLMDISLDDTTKTEIKTTIQKFDAIQKIDPIYSTPVGYQYVVVTTIYVDGNLSTFESHELADEVASQINQLERVYDTIIHVHPMKLGDAS